MCSKYLATGTSTGRLRAHIVCHHNYLLSSLLHYLISLNHFGISVHLHPLHVSFSSSQLVSQDALSQATLLGRSSMGGAWVESENTDWTLFLRTGALAGHPPSASDGRGRWESQNQPHFFARLCYWRYASQLWRFMEICVTRGEAGMAEWVLLSTIKHCSHHSKYQEMTLITKECQLFFMLYVCHLCSKNIPAFNFTASFSLFWRLFVTVVAYLFLLNCSSQLMSSLQWNLTRLEISWPLGTKVAEWSSSRGRPRSVSRDKIENNGSNSKYWKIPDILCSLKWS